MFAYIGYLYNGIMGVAILLSVVNIVNISACYIVLVRKLKLNLWFWIYNAKNSVTHT